MASLITTSSVHDLSRPLGKALLLLVSDSVEQLCRLRASLNCYDMEVRGVSSLEELQSECARPHTLAAIDVNSAQLPAVLDTIRASREHSEIPVFVENSRINQQPPAAGLLPKYRAMPCSLNQMIQTHMGAHRRAKVNNHVL
jgi:hypothetical protein